MSERAAVFLWSVWAAAGCAAAPAVAPAPQSEAADESFHRSVDAFTVLDERGVPYALPFFGGLNVPRPQWVDIDADGDLDLFLQERTDRLFFFERIGTPSESRYAWRPDRFLDVQIGEWYRFADVDADGDVDLLAEKRFSYVRLFRNEGSAQRPSFALATDTLRDTRGAAIFSDRQNIPNAADIDCDGRLDLFIGRLVGTITRYEATGELGLAIAPFRQVTDRFEGIEIVSTFGKPAAAPRDPNPGQDPGASDRNARPPSLHGANTMALADVDHDGDVDMFWGDFFEPGLLFIENTGTCLAPDLRGEPRPFPLDDPISTSGYNAPTFGDVDGDGDLDLLMGVLGGAHNANTTTADNLLYFEQTEDGFKPRTSRYLSQIDVGSESYPALLDWDGDGDLDLLLANKIDPEDLSMSRVYRFENLGDTANPRFQKRGPIDLDGAYHNAPAFGDLDADGDLDLLLGRWRKELAYFRNEGTPTEPRFVRSDSAFVVLTRGSNATPALGDMDADGDLDLFVGESSGAVNFLLNAGTPEQPAFELVSDEYLEIDVGRRSAPTLVDLDRDGDLDLVIGSGASGLLYYRNDGTRREPRFVPAEASLPSDVPAFAAPVFADIDGDDDLDLFVGGIGGGVYFYERADTL